MDKSKFGTVHVSKSWRKIPSVQMSFRNFGKISHFLDIWKKTPEDGWTDGWLDLFNNKKEDLSPPLHPIIFG